MVSGEACPIWLTWSKVSMPRSWSIFTNFTKISAVHPASSTARWWFSRETPSAFATVSSLKRFNCGSKIRAKATVSMIVNSFSIPCLSQFLMIKLISKSALCATMIASPQNSINCGRIVSIFGASITISSRMEVSSSIRYGIGTSGLTNVEKRSVISPCSTFTAPISMILFLSGENPVVSRSNTT